MPVTALLALSTAGGLVLIGSRRRPVRAADSLAAQLAAPGAMSVPADQPMPGDLLSTEQHLALSAGLLGMTSVAHLGLPLLSLLSLPGLLYLNVYFIDRAFHQWQRKRQVGIEINDAVLATGLLATGQWAAGALFAAFYFTGRKLEEKGNAGLERAAKAELEPVEWQAWIDRGALPLLLLSAVSAPFLGTARALGVLVSNFGYDYRVLVPLATLRHLQAAQKQGIWVRDARVLERLRETSVLVVDGAGPEEVGEITDEAWPPGVAVHHAAANHATPAAQIARWQAAGHTVAYFSPTLADAAAVARADVVISHAAADAAAGATEAAIHVRLQSDRPEQLVQIFALATALDGNRRRGLGLALAPSILNLGGIYLWQVGPIAALLVDYAGLGAGALNALWPPPGDASSSARWARP